MGWGGVPIAREGRSEPQVKPTGSPPGSAPLVWSWAWGSSRNPGEIKPQTLSRLGTCHSPSNVPLLARSPLSPHPHPTCHPSLGTRGLCLPLLRGHPEPAAAAGAGTEPWEPLRLQRVFRMKTYKASGCRDGAGQTGTQWLQRTRAHSARAAPVLKSGPDPQPPSRP